MSDRGASIARRHQSLADQDNPPGLSVFGRQRRHVPARHEHDSAAVFEHARVASVII